MFEEWLIEFGHFRLAMLHNSVVIGVLEAERIGNLVIVFANDLEDLVQENNAEDLSLLVVRDHVTFLQLRKYLRYT